MFVIRNNQLQQPDTERTAVESQDRQTDRQTVSNSWTVDWRRESNPLFI